MEVHYLHIFLSHFWDSFSNEFNDIGNEKNCNSQDLKKKQISAIRGIKSKF